MSVWEVPSNVVSVVHVNQPLFQMSMKNTAVREINLCDLLTVKDLSAV
jgi:hypothetical protein